MRAAGLSTAAPDDAWRRASGVADRARFDLIIASTLNGGENASHRRHRWPGALGIAIGIAVKSKERVGGIGGSIGISMTRMMT